MQVQTVSGPHAGAMVSITGNTENPTNVLILVHGRGGNARNILGVLDAFQALPNTVVFAPEANGHVWYPQSFTAALSENEPSLSSALEVLSELITHISLTYGIETKDVILAGFSQGACLVSEFAYRNPGAYKGVVAWSGGLIGLDAEVDSLNVGDLSGTPVYLGCDEVDHYIPADRVERSSQKFRLAGAEVTLEFYDHFGHAIHPNGLRFVSSLLRNTKANR